MDDREKTKLRNWVRLRERKSISALDVLKSQRKAFYFVGAMVLGLGLYSLCVFGFYSLPFGVFLGGLTPFIGYVWRARKNIAIELRYVDWKKVEDALNENGYSNRDRAGAK